MAAGIFEQVADQAAQKRRLAPNDESFSLDRAVVVAGCLLGREREQVDLLDLVQRANRLEATCEQDLVDQEIELGDILSELGLALRILLLRVQLDA